MKPHPVFTNYAATEDGQVFNLLKGKPLKGSVCGGYRKVGLGSNPVIGMKFHRFVYECFKGEIGCDMEIDHIDSNKLNNSFGNLQPLTRSQHAQITRERERSIGSRAQPTRMHAVQRVDGDGSIEGFPSLQAAEQGTSGASYPKILLCLQGKRLTHAGYRWRDVEDAPIEDEIWCGLMDYPGLLVSDKGRVQGLKQRPKVGFQSPEGYLKVSFQGHHYFVHRLVCLAFQGRPPQGYTVDHIDRDKKNNRANNLRWASNITQANNKRGRNQLAAH